MLKVLVVDDNHMICKSIQTSIDWDVLGCEVVGEAENGNIALELIEKHLPDIVITDIRMPGLDGLQLTERIKALLPRTKVIIITGFDDFVYAQKAVKLKAFDFILKPIDTNDLTRIVYNAVKEINDNNEIIVQSRKLLDERDNLKKKYDNSIPELRKKFLFDVMQGVYKDSESIELKAKQMELIFSRHVTYIIKPELEMFKRSGEKEKTVADFLFEVDGICSKLEGMFDIEYINFWFINSLVVVAIPRKFDSDRNLNIKMMEICSMISKHLHEKHAFEFTIGLSNPHKNVSEIMKSHNEARFALDCKFFIDNKTIIHAGSLKSKGILNEYPIISKVNHFYEHFRNGAEDIDRDLQAIFDEIKGNTTMGKADYIKSLLADLCMNVKNILYEKDIHVSDQIKSSLELHDDIFKLSNLSECFTYVQAFIKKANENMLTSGNKDYSQTVRKVINYLNENSGRKISLQEIADKVMLSPEHLSRQIRKETGETFTDLLNKIKVNAAIRLLKETNLKVYEVANQVGIDNYAYFYQLFKKATGVSPKDYAR